MNIIISRDRSVRLTQQTGSSYNIQDIVFYIAKTLNYSEAQLRLTVNRNRYPFILENTGDIQNYKIYKVIFTQSVSLNAREYDFSVLLDAEEIKIGTFGLNAIHYEMPAARTMMMRSATPATYGMRAAETGGPYGMTDQHEPVDIVDRDILISNNQNVLVAEDNISQCITFRIPQFYDGYLRPDYYNVRFELNNGICDPALNGYDFKLLVKYPSWIMEQNWNDVVALLNDHHNGGYIFDKYEWFVNGRLLDIYKGANLYLNDIHVGDEVFVALTRSGENYSIPTCPIVIEDKSNLEQTSYPVLVSYANAQQKVKHVNIDTSDKGNYVLYDILGHVISKGKFNNGDHIELLLPDVSGYYLLHLYTEQSGYKCVKLIR